MRIEDYEAIRDGCTECSEVGALLNKSTNVVYNGHSSNNTGVRGYTWTMLSLNNIDIALGRGFTPADEDHATKNVIVGYDIVDNLLGDGDPIGKEIRVDGIPYTIIGVGDRQGKTLGQSQDNWVAVPITTYQQIYGYNDSVDIYARANGDAEVMERAKDEVRVLMRTRRHDAPGTAGRFRNRDQRHVPRHLEADQFAVRVGRAGPGIDRAGGGRRGDHEHHAGQRDGADARDRRAQGAGRQAARRAAAVPDRERVAGADRRSDRRAGRRSGGQADHDRRGIPDRVPIWAIFLGLFLATAVGIFFGVYPASKAAKLDPVVALRAEM